MIRRHSPYAGLLHEVVEHAGTLYFSGIVAEDLSADMKGQADDVFRQLGVLLRDNGSDSSLVLQATAFVTRLDEKEGFNAAWKAFFEADHLPARATVAVADLGAGVRLELVVVAAKRPST